MKRKIKYKKVIFKKKVKKNYLKYLIRTIFPILLILIIFLVTNKIIRFKFKGKFQKIGYNITKNITNNITNNLQYKNILPKLNIQNDSFMNLNEIFKSRELFINDLDLSHEYIKYIRPINISDEERIQEERNNMGNVTKIDENYFKKRQDQYSYKEFVKICQKEELINSNLSIYDNQPLISVIACSYNRENFIIQSIRSIQNQRFKNIEIIIVDDGSTDNSKTKYKYLLESDPRIRIFYHNKNLGTWRTRLDGFLYSRSKYIIFFDIGDYYEDNYVLEDFYILMEKYNLDSLKMIFRLISSYSSINFSRINFHVYGDSKIVYGTKDIEQFNTKIFDGWGNIWNRIIRANTFINSLNLVNDKVLNIYQTKVDDWYYNIIVNKVSYNFLIIERVGYVYYYDGKGEGTPRFSDENLRNKAIQHFVSDLYYVHNFLPKNDSKTKIINKLKEFNDTNNKIQLNFFRSRFYLLNDLINILLNDSYVAENDKIFLNKLLNESYTREKQFKGN